MEIPIGQIIAMQSDALQVFRLVTGGGLKLGLRDASPGLAVEGGPGDNGAGQVGVSQVRRIQTCIREIGACQIRVGQRRRKQRSVRKIGSRQVGIGQDQEGQVRVRKSLTAEVDTRQIAPQVNALQISRAIAASRY